MQPRLVLPLTKAADVGYSQPTLGVGTDAVRAESLEGTKKKKKPPVEEQDDLLPTPGLEPPA